MSLLSRFKVTVKVFGRFGVLGLLLYDPDFTAGGREQNVIAGTVYVLYIHKWIHTYMHTYIHIQYIYIMCVYICMYLCIPSHHSWNLAVFCFASIVFLSMRYGFNE